MPLSYHGFKDATLVVLTNTYVKPAGFTLNQALFKEGAHSPYANVIVVQTKQRHRKIFQKLIDAMHSEQVLKAVMQAYPDGAAVKAW